MAARMPAADLRLAPEGDAADRPRWAASTRYSQLRETDRNRVARPGLQGRFACWQRALAL